jgi:uncharacterized protein YjbI with pentapeptide repeats
MSLIKLKSYKTGEVIFSGLFENTKECLEHAVRKNICLDYVDLSHANLVNANLDDARMRQACMLGANLVNANLSEAVLDGCDFINSSLQNTFMCYSSLKGCNFEGTGFGATDIFGAVLSHCRFSTSSAFSLKFREAETMRGCVFKTTDSVTCQMSNPPIVIEGLDYPVIFTDHYVIINGHTLSLHNWRYNLPALIDARLIGFFEQNQEIFSAIAQKHSLISAHSLEAA